MNTVPSRHYRIDEPSVVSEIIDDEAVILDLRTGIYFSTRFTGATVWGLLERGADTAALMAAAPDDAARSAIAAFIAELTENKLLVAGDSPAEPTLIPPLPAPFGALVLDRYSDMDDLLLLDPIHDVDLVGWPVRKLTEDPA